LEISLNLSLKAARFVKKLRTLYQKYKSVSSVKEGSGEGLLLYISYPIN